MTTADGIVFIVEGDAAARSQLVTLLEAEQLRTVACASTAELLATVDHAARGCVVTDLGASGTEGIELLGALKADGAGLPVIIVAADAQVDLAVRAMKAGAADFLAKPYESQRIVRAVRDCLDMDARAANGVARRQAIQRRLNALTPRERQVMDLVVTGASSKAIASALSISPGTVEGYRASLMAKMGAENLSDLVRASIAAANP